MKTRYLHRCIAATTDKINCPQAYSILQRAYVYHIIQPLVDLWYFVIKRLHYYSGQCLSFTKL